ncbi:hypothetical protein V8C34DRAFT_287424 [Trichoderma compactum]
MKPQPFANLSHYEILFWAIDLIVPFCRDTLLPTWGSSSNSLALVCLAFPRLVWPRFGVRFGDLSDVLTLLLFATLFFLVLFCLTRWAWDKERAPTWPVGYFVVARRSPSFKIKS